MQVESDLELQFFFREANTSINFNWILIKFNWKTPSQFDDVLRKFNIIKLLFKFRIQTRLKRWRL